METNPEPIKEILDELFSLLEALETQSVALTQFLKDQGIATDEKLAPYLDRAGNASSVKWRAARARMQYLLSPVAKKKNDLEKEKEKEKEKNKELEKAPEEKQSAEKQSTEKPATEQNKPQSSDTPRDKNASADKKNSKPAASIPAAEDNTKKTEPSQKSKRE